MADSNITKRALAAALKELMAKVPFSKITVSDICDKCEMNRKSFYYHFKDKEDLVNWIFDTEFIEVSQKNSYGDARDGMEGLLRYFYENRRFYRKALKIEGQNSFSDHFYELCFPILAKQLQIAMKDSKVTTFQVNLFVDGIIGSIKRWLSEPDCMPPDEFISQIQSCIHLVAIHVYHEIKSKETDQ